MYKERFKSRWWRSKYNLGMVISLTTFCCLTILVFIEHFVEHNVNIFVAIVMIAMCVFVSHGAIDMFTSLRYEFVILPRTGKPIPIFTECAYFHGDPLRRF